MYLILATFSQSVDRLHEVGSLLPFFLLLCLAGDSLGQSINPIDSIAIASAYQRSLSASPPVILASPTACLAPSGPELASYPSQYSSEPLAFLEGADFIKNLLLFASWGP